MRAFELMNFPVFIRHVSGKSYLKINSPIQYVSLFIHNTGDEYRYELVRTTIPSERLESLYEDPDFEKIKETEFNQQLKKYIEFTDKLKSILK